MSHERGQPAIFFRSRYLPVSTPGVVRADVPGVSDFAQHVVDRRQQLMSSDNDSQLQCVHLHRSWTRIRSDLPLDCSKDESARARVVRGSVGPRQASVHQEHDTVASDAERT